MTRINKKKFRSVQLAISIIGLAYVVFGFGLNTAQAQTAIQKDSDYDGLSDQIEIGKYKTDPLKPDTDNDGYLDSAEILLGSDPLDSNDPAMALEAQAASSTAIGSKATISLPWYIARAAGIVSYILMFLVIMLGTGMTAGYAYKYVNPVKAWMIHKYLSLALGITLLAHMVSLLFDKFINFGWKDVLLPFASSFKPLLLGLGVLGFYMLLAVIFTSLFFRLKYNRAWRGVHYITYPLFIFSLAHGLLIGTDSGTLAMKAVYLSTGLAFFGTAAYRFLSSWLRAKSA